ncbi:hypothetical protein [Demequina subtropica]|uniref:hypothetical protein n=1 Tax=Demequina subtropica TaxID=1638989 RepID=UPI000784B946|nr:hypothetical protein [Demequina subtropica]
MAEAGTLETLYENKPLAGIATMLKSGAVLLIAGAAAAVILMATDVNLVVRLIVCGLALIPFVKALGGLAGGIGQFTAEGKVAIGVSEAGLRVPGSGLIPWGEVEKVTFRCMNTAPAQSAALERAIKITENCIVVTRTGEWSQERPFFVKASATAFQCDLRGGEQEYVAIARHVKEAAQRHGRPVELLNPGRPWMADALGFAPSAQ